MSGNTIAITQYIPNASPQQVYAALTTVEGLARWWWPHISDTSYRIDACVGGEYDIRSVAAGIGARGRFTALDPNSNLRFTWNWMNDGISTVEEEVEIHIQPADNGVTLSLTHCLAPQAGDGADLRQGWSDVLARLAILWE
ncbi:MAG: SRPBCC domain-containing protein [Anaerolineales bacterium]|nr:MAG: SRPBCC domain-containing protein [Anaerolineales bacterium]